MEACKESLELCMNEINDDSDIESEWPFNVISNETEFNYEYGYFGENQTPISLEEVELCRRLATAAKAVFGKGEMGLGNRGSTSMEPFWLVATKEDGDGVYNKITPELVKKRFNNTIFPVCTILIEPIEEKGIWWGEIVEDFSESSSFDSIENMWPKIMNWFKAQKEFKDTAFVFIGGSHDNYGEDSEDWPTGEEDYPPFLPRLMLGLTEKNSLCGLFGYTPIY